MCVSLYVLYHTAEFNIFFLLVSFSADSTVTIVTDPPGPVYPAGILIRFKCLMKEYQKEPVTHEW